MLRLTIRRLFDASDAYQILTLHDP
ncbi:hypothetical protein KL86PLE_90071 [uncultured Pleomorphomonas sp.]|uniref:Uncharacterized protein n=1 Tax=uncultured Pleomorphomonas sp. TaxID=442121 RepID=A0A212LML8_9HYPH|nr:hypothetical protein KL86PLE_90071 [uncultured Pleomorphomonas sp.]